MYYSLNYFVSIHNYYDYVLTRNDIILKGGAYLKNGHIENIIVKNMLQVMNFKLPRRAFF